MDRVDLVLLMSVNPGYGGQKFIDSAIPKIAAVRSLIDQHCAQSGREIRLQVDGGINPKNISQVAGAGADTFVAGSAVFSAPDPDGGYSAVIKQLKESARV